MMFYTWLPIFPGFYNTIFECYMDEWSLWDNPNNVDDEIKSYVLDIIWDKYNHRERENKAASLFIEHINRTLKENDIRATFTFQEVISPRYYNFTNDSVNVSLNVSLDAWNGIVKDIKDKYLALFTDYIKSHYTSCDGFMSHYTNDVNEWLEWISDINECENTSHIIGAVMDFYLLVIDENDILMDAYEYMAERIDEPEYIDYDDIVEKVNDRFELNISDIRELEKKSEVRDNHEAIPL